MRGPEGAATLVCAWLTARIPARLTRLEEVLGLDAGTLPTPGLITAQDRGTIGLEQWPAVLVIPQRMEQLELTDLGSDGSELYRVGYRIRVLTWVRAEDHESTATLRNRYALAIRETLLERKQLTERATFGSGAFGQDTSEAAVRPETITEDYSDTFVDDAGRTIAGGWVELVVTVNELLEGDTAAPAASSITVAETGDTSTIPQHPALS